MTWPQNPRPARSLTALVAEVDHLFPNRSKASDGMLGDAAHQTRDSDHNPWVKDGKVGVVTAVDITDGSAPGVPEIADFVAATLIKNRDPRVKYLIHEGLIYRSYDKTVDGKLIKAWTPAKYTGPNAHVKHGHVSVKELKSLYDSTAPWGLAEALRKKTLPSTKVTTARALLGEALKTAGPIRAAAIRAGLAVLPKR